MPDKLENRRIPYFGDFVLFDEIGRGGMGVVYNAQQTKLDRAVALKILHSTFITAEADLQRLRIEAEAAARLDHPNIVSIFEFGEHEGHPYLAMQLVEGESLAERIARLGPNLKERDAAIVMTKIARAVFHAHQHGVLHRDLKPGNILIDELGEPHVIDFGLAKCVEQDSGITQTGAFLGTPAYASPEQAAGNNNLITTASDIYSLGAILYALLTGQPPFVGESTAETIAKVRSGALHRPRLVRQTLSTNLETICVKCLEKEPARRYGSALELAEDLECFLEGRPIAARPVGTLERLWMWTRRNPVHAALGTTVSLVVIASIVGLFLWRDFRAREAEARIQILQRQSLLTEIQMAQLTAHSEGWSERAWASAKKAAKIQTIVKSDDLRNQAVALFAGLEAHRVVPFTNFGASSVNFDREGRRLLIGGFDGAVKLWDCATSELKSYSKTNSGHLAFANDDPVELYYDPSSHSLVLSDLAGSRMRREWKLPGQVGAIKVENNAPVSTVLAPDGDSVAAVLALNGGGQAIVAFHSNAFQLAEVLPSPPGALAISPDGSLVAVAQSNNRIGVWSVSDHRRIPDLPTGRNETFCLAFMRTKRVPESGTLATDREWLLAAGDSGGNVTLWDLHTQTAKTHYRGGHYQILAIAFSPDGTILASGGRGPVKLWDVATERLLLELQVGGSGEDITGLDFAPDGKRLAISTHGGNQHPRHVTIWQLESDRGIQTLRGLSSQISKVCFSADGQEVAALSHGWEVGIWNLATGELRRVFEVPAGEFADNAALAFDPSGERLAFVAFKFAKMWHIESGTELGPWPLPPGFADSLVFPDKDHLLLGRVEASVYRIRNLLSPDSPVTEDPEFNGRVSNIAVSGDGRFFVVEGARGDASERRRMIKAYDGFTRKELWRFPSTRTNASGALTVDASGKFVAFQPDNTLSAVVVELASGSPTRTLPWLPAAIGPEAGYYAVRLLDRGFSLVRATNPIPIVTLGIDGGESAGNPQFDPAGSQLAWGNTDGTVTVCDLKEVRNRLVLKQAHDECLIGSAEVFGI